MPREAQGPADPTRLCLDALVEATVDDLGKSRTVEILRAAALISTRAPKQEPWTTAEAAYAFGANRLAQELLDARARHLLDNETGRRMATEGKKGKP